MADQLEGARISPVKFIDQGDGSVAERLSIAEAGAAGNSAPALATNATGLIGWLRKLVDVLTGTLLVDSSTLATAAKQDTGNNAGSNTLMTAATYSAGLMATYTEQRASDSKTRTVTITRNGDGTIASQAATAWA